MSEIPTDEASAPSLPDVGETLPAPRPTDEMGRVLPSAMTDRELLEAAVTNTRTFIDIINNLGQNPMAAQFLPPGLGRG